MTSKKSIERAARIAGASLPRPGELPQSPSKSFSATDKELLGLAARAGGVELIWSQDHEWAPRVKSTHRFLVAWNPCEDNAPALWLAVKLGINIYLAESGFVTAGRCDIHAFREAVGDDPFAATRRVIVRAAAAIAVATS